MLAGIPSSDFHVSYRYQAVAAIAGTVSERGLRTLAQRSDVAQVALDGNGTAALNQSRILTHANEVYDAGVTGNGIVVAVLDTGIDTDHPDLADDILYERCFLSIGGCPAAPHPAEDDNGHGTNVAGIVTSDGTVAPRGIAPEAKIAAYKILNGQAGGSFSDWLAALDDIIANHPEVDIVNVSLQSSSGCSGGAVEDAVATLRNQGVATFIATGNYGDKAFIRFPGCIPEAISVGATYDASLGAVDGWDSNCHDATTHADQVACWSSSDDTLDLLAPGSRTTSTGRGGGASTYSGTSQATPTAAGVAALMLQQRPGMSVEELEARMKATGTLIADDLHDGNSGTNRTTPRVDARAALLSDSGDFDGDGCSDLEELGADPQLGGQRNPLDPWDFYDVNGDGAINLFDDILAVAKGFGPSTGPYYTAALDRSPPPPNVALWHTGPPDGAITLAGDIMSVAAQFGATCAGP